MIYFNDTKTIIFEYVWIILPPKINSAEQIGCKYLSSSKLTFSHEFPPSHFFAGVCVDTVGWLNNNGFNCMAYASNWCANGAFRPGQEWTGLATGGIRLLLFLSEWIVF